MQVWEIVCLVAAFAVLLVGMLCAFGFFAMLESLE